MTNSIEGICPVVGSTVHLNLLVMDSHSQALPYMTLGQKYYEAELLVLIFFKICF